MKIGIAHTTLTTGDGSIADPGEVAAHVEAIGLDSLWVSDHLAWDVPILDSTLALAAAAAVTERIELGFSVLQLALRPAAWAAKQIASLQTISGGRVVLGVGIGGHPEEEWHAAGAGLDDRARRTDAALTALPDMLAGKPTAVPDAPGASVTLAPAAPMPPVWIGGNSTAALRRAARLGDGWIPAAITAEDLREGRRKLAELADAERRPMPSIAVSAFAALDGGMGRDELAEMMGEWGFPLDVARQVVLAGSPAEVAETLQQYAENGVEHLVVSPFGGSWKAQCDVLAESVSSLR